MTIRKENIALVQFLEDNKNKKVSSILEEFTLLCEKKKRDNTAIYDKDRNVLAIFCWYHKTWEIVETVEFGTKSGTKTGLNTMCKEGVNSWTKANNNYKKATLNLLSLIENGDIDITDLTLRKSELLETKETIVNRIDEQGFKTEQEIKDNLIANGFELI